LYILVQYKVIFFMCFSQ